MPDDDKPNPIEDLRKGLGLLFRAVRTTIEQIPTTKLEDAVVGGAREVGRAIENVAQVVEQQVLGKSGGAPGEKSEKKDEPPSAEPKEHDDSSGGEPPKP